MSWDDDSPGATCPWPGICQCTHIGCDDGWINRHREDGTQYVQACPICRPEVARHLSDRSKTLKRLRRELGSLPRPSRSRGRRTPEDAT